MPRPTKTNLEDLRLKQYTPCPTGRLFHASRAMFRGIRGPIGCLPGDSEFLTPTGWMRMDQYRPGDQIAAWDSASGRVHFEQPLARIDAACDSFLEFASDSLVMQVSDEHRIPHFNGDGKFAVTTADKMARHPSQRTIPTTFLISRNDGSMQDHEIRLRIALCAAGPVPKAGQQLVFGLRKPRKILRLKMLLDALCIPYTDRVRRPTEHVITIPSGVLTQSMDFVWGLSCRQLNLVMEECVLWGGCTPDGEKRFCSTKREFVDAIQFAAHATGFRATLVPVIPKNLKPDIVWSLHIRTGDNAKNRAMVRSDTTRISRIPAPQGRKYCFTTSTGFFVARCRDTIFITGNSGKSVTCTMEVFSRALEAEPFEGVRRSRWAFVRSTYGELISTTMKTWSDWVPTQLCPITFGTVITGRMIAPLADGTKVDLEIVFLSMDREEDTRKMKSLELTGVWFNEAGELLESAISMGISRTGRFPGKLDGGAGRWYGAIGDTNPPPDDSWWYKWAEVEKPEGYEFFSQPPAVIRTQKTPDDPPIYVPNDGSRGLSPAENVEFQNLGYDYWLRMVPGKDDEWIKVFLMGQYGTVMDGRPVYGNLFNDAIHTTKEPLKPIRGLPLLLAWDFGLNASCAFIQFTPKGEMLVIDEVTSEETGIQQCVRELVRPKLNSLYTGMKIFSVGDPAGAARSQTTEQTCLQILADEGLPTESAPTNEFVARREAVAYFLSRMVDGKASFRLSPTCDVLRKGFLGRYQYRRMQIAGRGRFTDRPEKNEFSHIHDALQYGSLYLRHVKMDGGGGFSGRSRRKLTYKRPDNWT